MRQSIKVIYDAILAAATRDELIVVESDADSSDSAMLCAMSMDSLEITPLAVIYGKEAEKSEPAPFTADDDKFLFSMGITPFVLSEMDGATFGEHAE
ncbi:MAG: hypothetical protein WA354_07675 [Terracidiphilus sp.]